VVNECICGDMEFNFYRREARAVFLCGDFNDWHQTALPMTGMPGGWWKCRLRLAPGTYQFKYLADSEWYVDYAAFGIERGPLGVWNSVVLVREEPGDGEPRRALAADIAMPTQLSEATETICSCTN
jgi:1,4-alpha-glucan branching enzyme